MGMKQDEAEAMTATVVELLPNRTFRVELESREQVLAHPASAWAANFTRLRPGDRVSLVRSEHDRTRGRIVKLLAG
jgi:translation initiation factor IF-1